MGPESVGTERGSPGKWYNISGRTIRILGDIVVSSKEYLNFILEQLSELESVSYRAMMGEYILYYKGKIIGGIYDDRLLVKPVKSAVEYVSKAEYALPYEGAKKMLLVDDVDNKEYLRGLFGAVFDELAAAAVRK